MSDPTTRRSEICSRERAHELRLPSDVVARETTTKEARLPGLKRRRHPEGGNDNNSSIVITLALVFYSIGVWSERISGRLKPWHLDFFWLGLACDTWGTKLMFDISEGMTFDVHGVTGTLAIILMFVHAIWATIVLVRKDERWITSFHKLSVAVWVIWLVPYLSPMFFALGE